MDFTFASILYFAKMYFYAGGLSFEFLNITSMIAFGLLDIRRYLLICSFILLKVFEDTEFYQMEAEAHREAERDELNKEVRQTLDPKLKF